MGRLDDKVALITGAGTGVGRACMQVFASEGAKVMGVGRTRSTLDETCALVTGGGGEASVVTADLATEEGATAAFDETIDRYGRLDCLVNVAGVGFSWEEKSPGSMLDTARTTTEKWQEVMAINLDSCFHTCRSAVPQMQAQGGGSIVNVASISAFQGIPLCHAYSAAKAGMMNLTRSLCVAYAKDGIRANCVCPGYIDTPMIESVVGLFDDREEAEAMTPMARPGTPEENAYACLYFASGESSYCNGAVLVVDGGQTARQ